jgi:hypothetical protein
MDPNLPVLVQEPPSTPPQPPSQPHDENDRPSFDINVLSPLSGNFPRNSAKKVTTGSPRPLSPGSTLLSPYSPRMNGSESESVSINGSENARSPFNFQPTQYTAGRTPGPLSSPAKQAVGFTIRLIYGLANSISGTGTPTRAQVRS